MTCGDVLLVNYPFTDASGAKIRPVLIVSIDDFNHGEDLVLVPISSAADLDDPHVYAIRDSDTGFAETGLKCSSAVKWTKPLTISRRVVLRRLGVMPGERLSEIQTRVRGLFGS
ncbi:MAG: type II toxin-antitoxin system PemK/MazF family toxin [Planctomycetes bacterium]|nr:type II toxin-antitoxin system PemK/MazF family toxin [Planctomycetota bacterium]